MNLNAIANDIRKFIIKSVHSAKSGHPGGSLGIADIMAVLYFDELRIDPKSPKDPDRDRFVLSKGHCAPALYGALSHRGFFPVEDYAKLRRINSHLQGHPSMKDTPGVDMSTGSLGHGLSVANGMAYAGKLDGKKYRVYCVLGDGEIQEGQVWEAAMFAAHHKLDNLCAFVDFNGLQIDGRIEDVMSPLPIPEKFKAFNWNVLQIDGNSIEEIQGALSIAKDTKGRPTMVVAKTIKGKGVSFMENQANWHGNAPNDEQFAQAMKELMEVSACQI